MSELRGKKENQGSGYDFLPVLGLLWWKTHVWLGTETVSLLLRKMETMGLSWSSQDPDDLLLCRKTPHDLAVTSHISFEGWGHSPKPEVEGLPRWSWVAQSPWPDITTHFDRRISLFMCFVDFLKGRAHQAVLSLTPNSVLRDYSWWCLGGTLRDPGDWTWVGCVQSKCLTCLTSSRAPFVSFLPDDR